MSFGNGRSQNRTRGRGENDAPRGVIDFFKDFLSSPAYLRNRKKRILAGEANHLEILGHYYAFGNPGKRMVIDPPPKSTINEGLRHLSKEERATLFKLFRKAQEAATRQASPSSTPSGSQPTPSTPQGGSR